MEELAEFLISTDQEQSTKNKFLTRFGAGNLAPLDARP
jgi:hypothetical protein